MLSLLLFALNQFCCYGRFVIRSGPAETARLLAGRQSRPGKALTASLHSGGMELRLMSERKPCHGPPSVSAAVFD